MSLWYEDAYFFYAYAWVSNTISFAPINRPVYNYVRRDGSIMDKTFKKTPKAYDHVEISFRLFYFLKDRDLFDKHAKSWDGAFIDNIDSALRNMTYNSLPFLANKVSLFLKENIKYIEKANEGVSKSIQKKVSPIISEHLHIEEKEQPASIKHKIKKVLSGILYKLSPNYRMNRNIIQSLDSLHEKVDSIANKE